MAGRIGIAVVGLGRAGLARRRALGDHPRAYLAAVARTRPEARGETTLDEVLGDPTIAAAIVCTPNRLHAGQARALLEAAKHVAVEFPLAGSPGEAGELLALARSRRLVLHAEHIELLTASQQELRRRVGELGRPIGGELRFTGSSAGWVGDPALGGSPGLLAVGRLSRLVDLFGPAEVEAAVVEQRRGGHRLTVGLAFRRGGSAWLVEERGPGVERSLSWAVRCERGPLEPGQSVERGDLFRRDLDCFLDRIEKGAPSYAPDELVLAVLDLVAAIDARSGARG